ncbi:MAG: hypothetical protein KAU60_02660, partial [Desulfobacterales bacterium]|nr:hypothetical protein [Desulfobacterales bacterium]
HIICVIINKYNRSKVQGSKVQGSLKISTVGRIETFEKCLTINIKLDICKEYRDKSLVKSQKITSLRAKRSNLMDCNCL